MFHRDSHPARTSRRAVLNVQALKRKSESILESRDSCQKRQFIEEHNVVENQENTGSIRGHAGMAAAYSLTASDFSSCLDGQYTVVSNLCLTVLVHSN